MSSQKEEMLTRAKTVFNAASDYFDAPALSFWNRYGQQTIDQLSLRPGAQVLDVCCGSGASAIPAAIRVGPTGHIMGVDLAESLLELARQKSQAKGLKNIEFRCGDFENLGLPDGCFDAVVCVFGIFFVPDMEAAVQELWRMVRPGGKLAITSWGEKVFEPANQAFWEVLAAERPDLAKTVTPWERIRHSDTLQALLEAGGATQVQVLSHIGSHKLTAAEDWWTMVLGGGLRGIVNQLNSAEWEQVRQANLDFLQSNQIQALEVDVLYAIAEKIRNLT
ncbi:class I SAM-dependent methyltransferase [Thermosynechococcaceae cyanobacterium BACA0444]|uniref:Class I SAM-dependent methyltransferase n=1 Tax=Pseudocalidococcus azoricus BACA0444 TaxID=2918990 RepID=A0AAE4FTH5_9CYAN|nr:class I SAM-dependent methyltransferase [Pseudocalidococcus azoricus]MDS3862023.1 class I SAM-dependent methyltransferase [Pseudocalidococcus azoricus BACA0444]